MVNIHEATIEPLVGIIYGQDCLLLSGRGETRKHVFPYASALVVRIHLGPGARDVCPLYAALSRIFYNIGPIQIKDQIACIVIAVFN